MDPKYESPYRGRKVDDDNVLEPFARGELELDAADRDYISALYNAGIRRIDEIVADFSGPYGASTRRIRPWLLEPLRYQL